MIRVVSSLLATLLLFINFASIQPTDSSAKLDVPLALTETSAPNAAAYVSGDGIAKVKQDFDPAGNSNGNPSLLFAAKTITDAITNLITSADDIDTTPPTVLSIVRVNPSSTNLSSVDFIVTFSEPVKGVDMDGPVFDDFVLTTGPGISGAFITGVSGTGAVYTVTVNTGTGDGTIRLDVVGTVDSTPPANITNLIATTGTANGTVDLSWIAPGDDGSTGTAASYLVRYSASAIGNQTAWDAATPVITGLPTPKAAGQSETMTVNGLTPGSTYYFAIRARDEVPNLGGLSNSPSAAAQSDTTPPAAITDLTAFPGTFEGTVSLSWTATGDDGSTGTASSYLVRYSVSQINNETDWGSATPVSSGIPVPHVAGTTEQMIVTGLTNGSAYYFAVRALDEKPNSGGVSNSVSAVAAFDTIAPASITNLSAAAGISEGTVNLSWTAPGDNGSTGTANNYLVRYSSSAITDLTSWTNATPVSSSIPVPQVAGSTETLTVTGLTGGATYYFAVRARDEVPNLGALSNSPSAIATNDVTAPAAITTLAAYSGGIQNTVLLTWTAPGDNGSTGTATTYLVRYSASAISDETAWTNATPVSSGVPTPQVAVSSEQMVVTGLTGGTTYYFAIRAQDEIPNLGGLSNSPSAIAASANDTTSPSTISTLTASSGPSLGSVRLSWTASGDDGTTGTAFRYLIRYGTSIINTQAAWDNATPVLSGIPTPRAGGTTGETITISGLTQGATYYFAVRAQDEASNTGALSNSPSAVAKSGCGSITTNTTWSPSDSPIIATCDVTIAAGVTLTIQPGTILKFNSGTGIIISTTGTLNAVGTVEQPILFTANTATPTAGFWKGINFGATSANSVLNHVIVEYGGSGTGNVRTSGAVIQVENSVIRYSSNYGIYGTNLNNITISNNIFTNNAGYAAFMTLSNGSITSPISSTGTNNGKNGIAFNGSLGINTSLSGNNNDFPYIISSSGITINSGVSLTLPEGTVIKFDNTNPSLNVNGTLNVSGSSSSPVYFTSMKDDSVGGDTNHDGSATSPVWADWGRVYIAAGGSAVIDHAFIRYGGYGANMVEQVGALTLTNSTISYGRNMGLASTAGNIMPTLSNNSFNNNGSQGVYISTNTTTPLTVSIQGNTFNNNGSEGLYIVSNNAQLVSLSLSNNQFNNNGSYPVSLQGNGGKFNINGSVLNNTGSGNTNNSIAIGATNGSYLNLSGINDLAPNPLPYSFGTGITIPSDSSLTIEPGVIIKFQLRGTDNASLNVNGTLNVSGSSSSPVYFTSLKDDNVGGDTNHDGSATSPVWADWGRVYIAAGGSAVIDHAFIRYGGYGANMVEQVGALTLTNSTISYGRNMGLASTAGNIMPTLSNNSFNNNGSQGVYISTNTTTPLTVSIQGNTFNNNGSEGLYIVSNNAQLVSLSLSNNQFNNNGSYPVSLQGNGGKFNINGSVLNNTGSGNTNNSIAIGATNGSYLNLSGINDLAPNPLPYSFGTGITIPSDSSLTIEPGVIIKFQLRGTDNASLNVNGTLNVSGSSSSPVYFTSMKDDSVGGDTNHDGSATSPVWADWGRVYIAAGGSAVIDHAFIRYGGYGANMIEQVGALTLTNSTISYSRNMGISSANGLAIVHYSNIFGNSTYGIYNANTSAILDARFNWWGADSGPAPIGTGNGINYSTYSCGIPPKTCYTYYVDFASRIGQSYYYGNDVSWNAYTSDPVNTANGNYALQRTDLSIPTRSLPLEFSRSYNSSYPTNGLMGYGWTHTYNVYVTESNVDSSATVMYGDGRSVRFSWSGTAYVPPAGTYSTLTKVSSLFVLTEKDQTVYSFNTAKKLASITDKNGNVTSLGYTGVNLTSVTAPDGRALTFAYDGSNRVTQVTDPISRTLGMTYDASGDLVTFTDVTNKNTTYTYDANHRMLTATDANSHTFLNNVYNADGRVIEQRDADNNLTTFAYDIVTHITTVTDPRSKVTVYQYDADLRLVKQTDPLSNYEAFTWDASNNRLSTRDRRGNTTTYTYDAHGNLLTITDPLTHVTTYTYDSHNNLLTETDALTHATTYTYDGNDNLATKTDAKTGLTSYTYYLDTNRKGRLATITDPLLRVSTYDYNANGDLTSLTNALNKISTRTYDNGGRMLIVTDPLSHTTIYTYDNANRILTLTDPRTGITTNTYDDVGNLLTSADPLTHTTAYTYTTKDQIHTITDTESYITTYGYDTVGNRTSVTDGNNHTTTYIYDGANRLTSVTNPLTKTITYTYDANGNRTGVIDPLSHGTTYTYDVLNRLTTETDALTHATVTTYDAVGNVLTVKDANNHTTTYTYDELNRLSTVTDARSGVVTYTYDAVGNRLTMKDANNHTTTYTYDDTDHLLTEKDPLLHIWTYTYDDDGRRATRHDPNSVTTTYTYNPTDALIAISAPSISISYGYDLAGNRTSQTDSTGTTTYTYDALGRPTSIVQPNGTIGYTYDAVNRLSVTLPGSRTTTSTYSSADQLLTTTDWSTNTTTYTYDNAGRQITTTFPNGVVTTNTYDNADRLTGISTVKGGTTILSTTYTLDNVGNRSTMVEPSGTTTYTYDELNRLTGVAYPTGSPVNVTYTYDAMGNRLTKTEGAVTTNYVYDNADRLTSTTGGSALTYAWDDNGQMLSKGSQTFSWDALGRMTDLTNGGTSASYTYNADGVRVGRTVDGSATTYLQDLSAGLPIVLSETTGGNTSRYVYGSDLISQTDGAAISYFHTDGLGSTRALTNDTGSATDQYVYDAFGSERSHTGTSTNPYTYTGEQLDPEAGLTFLRARYYDGNIGRFISKDQYKGPHNSTQDLNPYIYVVNNPIKLSDPSGLSYVYSSTRFSAFLGLGVSIQHSNYYDPITGESKTLWNVGFGAGLPGMKLSTEAGDSTANIPNESLSIQTHGGMELGSGLGVGSELNLTSGNSSIIANAGNTKIKLASDMNVTPAVTAGWGSEASGTLNISYRTGALGDWLFNRFVQPYYDNQYNNMQAEHDRQMYGILFYKQLAKQLATQSNWSSSPPSKEK